MSKPLALRLATSAFGGLIIAAGGFAAAAADDPDPQEITISVGIADAGPGVLALSVASNAATLTENGSTDLVRQFTGTLPEVTVVDTRDPDDIPQGAEWAVVGNASSFVNGDDPTAAAITADHFGWSPQLVDPGGAGDGFVSVGGDVETVLDGDVGLVNQELLYLADSAAASQAGGVWSATADLFLRVAPTVTPGNYTSVLTLSLFE
jgi:hypothetical protein